MKKEGKKKVLADCFLFLFILLFLLFYLGHTGILDKIGLNRGLNSYAVAETLSVSITIINGQFNVIVPENEDDGIEGSVLNFTRIIANKITPITGLTANWSVNISLYGANYPSAFTEPEPNSSQAGATKIEYFEMKINASTAGGTYRIYFNVTQEKLNGVDPTNISLIIFDTVWTNLSTVVVSGTSDPAQFYGITTHFSKFLIGQKVAVEAGGGGGNQGGGDQGGGAGGGGGGGGGKKEEEVVEEVQAAAARGGVEEEAPPLKPIHKAGNLFDVGVTIPRKYQRLYPDEELLAEVTLINLGKLGATPVNVEYTITDARGNQLFKSVETKTVETELTYFKSIELPADIGPGAYMLMVSVRYNGDEAVAGYPFTVIEEGRAALFGRAVGQKLGQLLRDYGLYASVIAAMLALVTIIVLMHKKGRKREK